MGQHIEKLIINLLSKEQVNAALGENTLKKDIYFGEDNQLYLTPKEVEIATMSTPGAVKPSSDFDISDDGTISLYKAISLTASINPNTAEIGSVIDEVTVNWVTNKTPISLTVNGVNTAVTDTSKQITGLACSSNRVFEIVASDARKSVTSKPTLSFYRYVYSMVGNPNNAPSHAKSCKREATLSSFAVNGADFSYRADSVIWLLTTKQGAKIQTNVLGQQADVNTYGGEAIQFTQANGVTTTYYAYRTDVFRATGAAKYRIL